MIKSNLLNELPQLNRISKATTLRTLNGIGRRMVGKYKEPSIQNAHYEQFILTVFFIPVFFGNIYLVKHVNGKSRLLGTLTGRDFMRRFGEINYLKFKLSAVTESLIMLLAVFFMLVVITYGGSFIIHGGN